MNNSDFKQEAEKYKSEMMKIYKAGSSRETNEAVAAEILPKEQTTDMVSVTEQAEPELSAMSENSDYEPDLPDDEAVLQKTEDEIIALPFEERFPPPVIPDFISEVPKAETNNSYGSLKVSVRTGNGGRPVKDSLVTVSEIVDGKEHIVRMLTTNESGDTETIRLPAPTNNKGNSPQDYENFSKYNISVYSKGFYRETSVDAPIFSGITSVQTFYLIPEPFDYNSGEQTIINRNTEPEF